jgi:hypothetical protein
LRPSPGRRVTPDVFAEQRIAQLARFVGADHAHDDMAGREPLLDGDADERSLRRTRTPHPTIAHDCAA